MTHQILIASYTRDFIWLEPNLKSLRRYSRGFLPPVISVDGQDFFEAKKLVARAYPEATVVQKDGRRGQGFMRAQISMMQGDLLCPQADFTYLVGSDCIFWKEFSPEMYFFNGKPVMLYNSRKYFEDAHAGAPIQWMDSTAQILGFHVQGEYMRRLPIVYPKELFAPMRKHVELVHGHKFEDYIYQRNAQGGPVSESNILGAYAWEKMRDLYHWMHCDDNAEYVKYRADNPDPMAQFWSHGGLDRPTAANVFINGRCIVGRTPRDVMREVLGNDL